ncbi:MAG TPA: glycoside hydrolase family 16 protein [Candidatus Saccharimonadia bacterium]|nr:glycoside hydrolase family 16 protein [Candidatus Saccharimonadia bacterium]
MTTGRLLLLGMLLSLLPTSVRAEVPSLPEHAKLELEENWSSGSIDPSRWYLMRRHWDGGNHGNVPENVRVEEETAADGLKRFVLVCHAHGDQYNGPVRGLWNKPDRVGGIIASKAFFASGRFEVEMRVGGTEKLAGGTENPARPIGAIPAIWIYAGWNVRVKETLSDGFVPDVPLYHPYLQKWGKGNAFYTSEIDFPELGKKGDFDQALYNTFNHSRIHSKTLPVQVADGKYHTYTTEWRTALRELEGLRDDQVMEHQGFWWIRDLKFPFDRYWGNPVKRLGKDRYAVYHGVSATHWIDGKLIGENKDDVPSMAAQLSLGIWLPDWAGPAPWQESRASFGRIRVWQYHDEGDVRGLLTNDQPDNFKPSGEPVKDP